MLLDVVLSLFDGIACGRIALERARIQVDTYYASEIEKGSIAIATSNYPDIVEIGDICKVDYKNGMLYTENGTFSVGHIDMIIGGSPCTDFSSIGYANGMKAGQVEIVSLEQYMRLKNASVLFNGQSYLFWEYVRLLNQVNPDYFLLENVVMSKKWQQIIDKTMGIAPLRINSSLLSAQNRPRLYWTNIFDVTIPSDKHIVLSDILDNEASVEDVSHCQTVQRSYLRLMAKYGYIPQTFNAYNAMEIRDKACALSRGSMVTSSCATLLFIKVEDGVHIVKNGILDTQYPVKFEDGRYNLRRLSFREMERLQTIPDDYTKVEGVGVQKRSMAIGNAWTVDVIAHIFSFLK